MKFNQKLIKQLAAGEIVLDTCLNEEMAESILKATGLPVRNEHKYRYRYYYRNAFGTIVNNGVHYELKAVPVSDFLLPEPRFKKGDIVILQSFKHTYVLLTKEMERLIGRQGVIVDVLPINENRGICYYVLGWVWPESALKPDPLNGAIIESQTMCGSEKQFMVGKEYEFSDGEDWVKGKAVGTVDYEGQRNFIADIGGNLSVFEDIRPIQPKEITKEDLVKLLEWWQSLSDNLTADDKYHESFANLVMNSGNILQQLKQQS